MTYGPAKRRDIARSVLPSTNRKPARRALAAERRRNRRHIRTELRTLIHADAAEAVVDTYDDLVPDLTDYPDAAIRQLVVHRQGGDKLGPLFRWARATTAHLPIDDRLPAVRRLFPDNLIGRHAVGHLAAVPDLHTPLPHEFRYWLDLRCTRDGTHPSPDRLAVVARRAIEEGDHADLNRWMRGHPAEAGAVRLLAGWHDVDAFASACDPVTPWRRALLAFGRGERD